MKKQIPPNVGEQPEPALTKEAGDSDVEQKDYGEYIYVPYGITSFDALDAHVEARETTQALRGYIEAFSQMSSNIMCNTDPNFDKVAALEVLTAEFIIRIGDAANMDGNPPDDDYLDALEEKAYAAGNNKPKRKTLAQRLGLKKGQSIEKSLSNDEESVELNPIFVQKDLGGQYRWLLVYSNHFIDRAGDLITKEAHKNFVAGVEAGTYDYPTIWHWHMPFAAWGKADKVGFDEDTGMAWAEGYVMPGFEVDAEAIMKSDEPIGVSHSMPRRNVVRDPNKPHHILGYKTIEFSDLPLSKAANQLTTFTIKKEGGMPTQDQILYLQKMGWKTDEIEGFGKKMQSLLTEGLTKGLEHKSLDESTPVAVADAAAVVAEAAAVVETVAEVAAEPVVTEVVPTTTVATPIATDVAGGITREEIAEGMRAMSEQIMAAVAAALSPFQTALSDVTTIVKELAQSDEEKIVKSVTGIPQYSIASLLKMNPIAADNSPAILDGRTTLAKSAPNAEPAGGGLGTIMSIVNGQQ